MIYLLILGLAVPFFIFLGKWQSRVPEVTAVSLNQVKKRVSSHLLAEQARRLDQQVTILLSRGWSAQTLARCYLPSLTSSNLDSQFQQVSQLGSPLFQALWQTEEERPARSRLALALSALDLSPGWERSEESIETRLDLIADLPPHDAFWIDLAETVSQTFPGLAMTQKNDDLARQTHQLRYLLSLKQGQWLTANHGGESDRQALQTYLRSCPGRWTSRESARLHNKVKKDGSGSQPVNLKVLVNYHSEFILDQEGRLLNILDGSAAGLVNGASFNYAHRTNRRHWELDVLPVAKHDLPHRRQALKAYRSPKRPPFRLIKLKKSPHQQLSQAFDREVGRRKLDKVIKLLTKSQRCGRIKVNING